MEHRTRRERPGGKPLAVRMAAAALPAAMLMIGTSAAADVEAGRRAAGPGPSFDVVCERIAERLDLTDEQAEAVRAILERRMAERHAAADKFRKRMRRQVEERNRQRAECMAQIEEELSEVLTEEQLEEFLEARDRVRERLRARFQKDGPARAGFGFRRGMGR